MDYEMLTSLQAFIDANPTIGNYCMLLRSLELIQIDMCWYGRDGPAKATKSLFTFLRHAGTPALQRVMVIADFYWLDPAQIYGSDESAASGRTIPDLPPLASFVCYLHAEATPATCNMLQRQLQAIFPNALVVVIDGYCDADDRVCYYYYNGEVRIPRMTVRPSELAEAWPSRLMLREPSLRAGPSHCKVQEPTEQ
ncbi:hypothetical protein BD414DRAFT_487065 [Trametes punicea]|nr:hypothetical protein BD414DRAFT_487065 [Trametes punicea]